MSSPVNSESAESPEMDEASLPCSGSDPVNKDLCSTEEEQVESGQLNQMGSRTRETVQKVYQMLEKHKATSCSESEDFLDDDFLGSESLFDDSPTKLTGRSSQQQRASSSRSSNSYQSAQSSSSNRRTSGASYNSYTPNSSNRNSPARRNTKCDTTATDDDNNVTFETEEETQLASLRCPSERTELVSEREQRRRKRCSDYPGFAFGFGSVFGSDTMMKFSIIRNELHNVINGQLKRVCCHLDTSVHLKDSSIILPTIRQYFYNNSDFTFRISTGNPSVLLLSAVNYC